LYAYRDMDLQRYEKMKAENDHFETEASRDCLEDDLIMFALFGLEDPIRPEVGVEFEKFGFEIHDESD